MGTLSFLKTSEFDGQGTLSNRALDQAASLLAGAGDKGTLITVDEVIYLNSTLGINNLVKDEYFDFMDYTYNRSVYENIEVWLLIGPIDVVFVADPETYTGYYEGWVDIMEAVFNDEPYATVGPGAAAFATSASEALQVLSYVHERSVPEY